MADVSNIIRAMRDTQRTIRRQLDARNVSLKVVAFDSGVKYGTLCTYFPSEDNQADPVQLPISALYALCGHIPDDLLSLLLPDGRAIVRVPEGVDHDEVEAAARDFLAAKGAAHHPMSEAGRDLGPGEVALLSKKAVRLCVVAA